MSSDSESSEASSEAAAAVVSFNSKTLARLFAEHFERPDTRISASAVEASAEYLRIFTREAIWRTDKALKDAAAAGERVDGKQTRRITPSRARMMEAEDLERIAGTLVLDF
ncbi:CENP-S associating centromere protein X-domain-containing protein [Lipomyces orientalis]|uniref:CENP-S associating centromere protein X-domain-containing protein n=1 Tax=Lipomyces orientalis TaxID=1233043 RepID=A0ACC3TZ32_9ASCO